MKRFLSALGLGLVALAASAPVAAATHNADVHTDNMSLVGNFRDGGEYREGSDLGFQGNFLVAGNYNGMRVIDISNPRAPSEVGELDCVGSQADVTIYNDLVFMSVDSPRATPNCGGDNDAPAPAAQQQQGTDWEGVRIVSIADPAKPVQIKAVRTDCGSHTHTLVPDPANNRVLIYVNSYPVVAVRSQTCNDAQHEQLSVIEVPLGDPQAAKVASEPKITTGESASNGCHDVTVYMERKLAAFACLQDTMLADISDPVNPKPISRFKNPDIMFDHSTAFSNDGKTMIVGDEYAGAAAPHQCATTSRPGKFGALWFYDVSDPKAPVERGSYILEPQGPLSLCTAHNFNPVPLRSGKNILVAAFYEGGTAVIDFTDPSRPAKIGGYIPKAPAQADAWSSYWYNGFIYSNHHGAVNELSPQVSRGIDVLSITHPDIVDPVAFGRLNPQTMESIPPAGTRPPGQTPPVVPPVAPGTDRFLISKRPIRIGRDGIARIRVYCRSSRACQGRMHLRTVRRSLLSRDGRRVIRAVTLGVRSFRVNPSRGGSVLTFRLSRGKLRYFARSGRRRQIDVAARVRFVITGRTQRVTQRIGVPTLRLR